MAAAALLARSAVRWEIKTLARVELLANVSYDHIWWLDHALVPGARIHCRSQEIRLGGGGTYTAAPLLRDGHHVHLVASMPDCLQTHECLAEARALGIDTGGVALSDDEPTITDIFVEPDGERTIISRGSPRRAKLEAELAMDGFVYVNSRRLDEYMLRQLADHPAVIGQYSQIAVRQFPARILIGSVADHPNERPRQLFERAARTAGPRFEALILTAGEDPVVIVGPARITSLEVTPCGPVSDTIGAGDTFAGGVVAALANDLPVVDAARRGIEEAFSLLQSRKRCEAGPKSAT
jgi:sugar/nucleoside kinase (ribokinase family)